LSRSKEVVIMNTIRSWGFPVAVLISWLFFSGHTLSRLAEMSARMNRTPAQSQTRPVPRA